MLSCPYFVKKKSILSKTQCSHVIFFNFLWKIPYCHAHIWSKNVNSVKTALYYGPTKSIGCPFFPICHEKITALMPIFGQKNVHSLEKHTALMPIFCQKNVHSLKNTVLSCHFFFIFHEKPPAFMPIFGQNNVNSVKTTLYYGPKKSMAKKK